MRAVSFEPKAMIKVIWLDIVQDPAWQKITDAVKDDPVKVVSIGFYLSGKNRKLNMCHSITEDGESDSLVIPWGAVASIEEVEVGSDNKNKDADSV